ncbi:unnamed protein product [Spirodela intermedia]|uniref:RING-type E3 ubiquitin transferase n=1 Tax=Spirodela intermedia TaxID=51605 RepID=A0A7I8IMT1_SPIIN|nr:unnamed protein product [Spirodela intermedia]CAA6658863.1 unnamed protein product [Spirodela intermedia]
MAVIVIGLISAFFFMAFFSIYLRNRRERDSRALTAGGNGGARSRRVGGAPRGLEAAVIQTFPTLVYSEVKEHKIGKGALECAVCLSEFEDDDTLRLLPKCDHVFHPDCIDLWLASHTTCPSAAPTSPPPPPPPATHLPLPATTRCWCPSSRRSRLPSLLTRKRKE